ncbi:MAG: MotA/TolQ/ExbB proton channel family protein [Planctomycetes bacterium]|nr:MotA/TolQ/ExbB proton channel family protein [Planctomycetota bacterium]
MDIATIIGLLAGFGMVAAACLTGGGAGVFIHIPSMMITVGGMFCATLIHFSLGTVLGILSVAKKTLFCRVESEQDTVQRLVDYAAISRRDGALALEQQLKRAGDPFLVKGIQMLIDGQKEEAMAEQLATEVQYLQERHETGKKVMEFMGSSAPAFGMIGTLIGLVQMLRELSSPDSIGSGMATALITTFYGALLANLVFLPLAGKLGLRSKAETIQKEMITEGLLAIARGESPTSVRERMQAFVSAKHREELKPSV